MKFSKSSILFFIAALLILPFSNGRWLMAWAGFLGPMALLMLIRSLPKRKGLWLGYGTLVLTSCISWITVNKVVSGPLVAIGVTFAGIAFFFPYLLDRIARPIGERTFLSTFYFPVSWVAMEALFSVLIADQGSIAYSQFENRPLLQLVSLIGMSGVTFVIAWTASTASWLYENKFDWNFCRKGSSAFLVIFSSVFIFGCARERANRPNVEKIKVAAITLNLGHPFEIVSSLRKDPQNQNLQMELEKRHQDILNKTRNAAAQGAKVLLWSEVLGDTIGAGTDSFIKSIPEVAKDSNAYLFAALGINSYDDSLTDNKVILFKPDGEGIFSYQKANLSPGEASIQGKKEFRFTNTTIGRLGTAICADFNFSHFMRSAGLNGVDIVFDPAAEWIEVARIQEAAALFRAVENGFNLVKATSYGYSFIADYTGRILAWSDYKSDDPLLGEVPTKGRSTIYSKGGWLFSFFILLVFGILLFKQSKSWWRIFRE